MALQKPGDNYGIVLRKRRMLYATVMTASLLGCTLLLLFVLDIFSPANKAETEISNSLERYEEHLSMYFSNTAGQGIRLAGIAAVKSGAASKTNIHEIDDLLEHFTLEIV